MAQRDLDGLVEYAWEDSAEKRVLLRVGGEDLHLAAREVLEILAPARLVRLPGAPPEVPGIISRRGSPATVVDLGLVLGGGACCARAFHRLIVTRWRGYEIAVAVDDVVALGRVGGTESSRSLDLEALFERVF